MTLVRLRSWTIVEKQAVVAVAEASRRKSFTSCTMKAGRCPANPISRLEQDGVKQGNTRSGQKCSQETPLSRICSDKSCTVGSDPEGHKCRLEDLVAACGERTSMVKVSGDSHWGLQQLPHAEGRLGKLCIFHSVYSSLITVNNWIMVIF